MNKESIIKGIANGTSKAAEEAKKAYEESKKIAKEKVIPATKQAYDNVANKTKELSASVKENSKNKKKLNYESLNALQPIVNVLNEAGIALNDKDRIAKDSPLNEVIVGAVGAGMGGVISFTALYGLGTVGLSAAGITSGLAAAGLGLGMVGGIFVLAAPVAILAGTGIVVANRIKSKQLRQEKERLYKETLKKHEAIIEELRKENQENKERLNYLQGLNILLQKAVTELKQDLEYEQ